MSVIFQLNVSVKIISEFSPFVSATLALALPKSLQLGYKTNLRQSHLGCTKQA